MSSKCSLLLEKTELVTAHSKSDTMLHIFITYKVLLFNL